MTVQKNGHFFIEHLERNPCGKLRTKDISCNSACNLYRAAPTKEAVSTCFHPHFTFLKLSIPNIIQIVRRVINEQNFEPMTIHGIHNRQ